MPVVVHGQAELLRALTKAPRDVRLGIRAEYRNVAEPVRSTAEQLAGQRIRNLGEGRPWSRMRVGITRKLVYVAPRQRGVKTRGADPRRRPNLGTLLMDRAMEPALERHENEIAHRFEEMLDTVADKFNRG